MRFHGLYPALLVIYCCSLAPNLCVGQANGITNDPTSSEPTTVLESMKRGHKSERENMIGRALAWYTQEKYPEARLVLDSVAHDARGKLIVDSLSGLAFHMAGMTYFQTYDDAQAVPMYRKAIQIRDALYPGPHIHRAHTRYNLANSMHWLGRPDTATVLLRDAIAIYDGMEQTDTTNWLRSLKLLGVIGRESNDRQLTRSALVAMVNLLGEYSQPTPIDLHQMSYDAVKHYQYLREYDKAETFVPAAIAGAKQAGEYSMVADVIATQGGLHYERGDLESARKLYHRAIVILDSVQGDPTSLHIIYENLAATYQAEKDYETALQYHQKARTYPPPTMVPFADANSATSRATTYEHLGRSADALKEYEKGLVAVGSEPGLYEKGGIKYLRRDSARSATYAGEVYANRARFFLQAGKPAAALADLEEVFAYQDVARDRLTNEGSRYALSEEVWKHYDLAVHLHHQIYLDTKDPAHLWRSFALSERAKAYSQLAALQQNHRAADRREQDLRNRLAQLERDMAINPGLESEYANQQLRLELHVRARQLPVEAVDTELDRGRVLEYLTDKGLEVLEYHLGKERSYGFYLNASGAMQSWAMPGADTLQELVENYRAAITEGAYRGKSLREPEDQGRIDRRFLTVGKKLAEILLPPGSLPGDRLLIVPDGALHYLPFAALFTGSPAWPLDYTAIDYLRSGREISTTFSLRYLLELEHKERGAYTSNLLAFAPSFGGRATVGEVATLRGERLTATKRMRNARGKLPGLEPLARNREEVRLIAAEVPRSKSYLDLDASLESFLASVGGSRIVHIASHGLVDPTNPSLSFLAFAQRGEDLDESELLYFNDLQVMPVNAELVVLSACETSLGKIAPGESILSLGNAFAAAGARSTVTSLWNVDDAATEELMVGFYDGLLAGLSRPAALAQAQQTQMTGGTFGHPYYWSGMVLNGDIGPVPISGKTAWWTWLIAGLCGVGVLVGFGVLAGRGKLT